MSSLLRFIDRVLLNPWTSRLGAIQAIVAFGIFVAGLIGGLVTVLFGFPTLWAVLTAVGAFLLAASGAALVVDRQRERLAAGKALPPAISSEKKELRRAVGWLLEDLEGTRTILEDALAAGEWWRVPSGSSISFFGWTERGEVVAEQGYHDEHAMVRAAVRSFDRLEDRGKGVWAEFNDVWGGTPPHNAHPLIHESDEPEFAATIEAFRSAESALAEAQR